MSKMLQNMFHKAKDRFEISWNKDGANVENFQ